MKRSVLLSTFLFAAVLSPIFLYGYTCAPRPDARLAVLELRAGDFHGENVIEGFSPNVFSYDVPFPESESVGVLWFRAQDPRATIEVQYDGEFVPLAWHSVAKLDVPLGSSELSIKVSVRGSGFLPSSRTYRVRIQRGDLCEGVVCDDQNECTDDVCDSVDGQCVYTNVSHGTTCDLGGLPGECAAGVCQGLCPSIEITPTRMIPNVMFLVDQSGSMAADFGGGLDRWEATHGAIMQIISELDSIVRFGLTTYTSDDGDANPPCPRLPMQVDFALNNSGTIGDPMVYSPTYPTAEGHDTPTGDSIDTLVSIIQSDPPPAEGGTIIVLAIDGEPDSCEVPDPNPTPGARAEAVTAASNSHNAGIDVLLLWIGALTYADTEGHIQEVANVGVGLAVDGSEGDAPFWVGTDPQDLENDFREMIASSISCDVQTDKRFDDKEKACNEGDVRIDGVPLSCPSDWRVKPGVDDVIELVGSACDTFKSGDVTFTATFPCGAIVGGTGGTGGAGGTGGVGGTGGIGGAPGTGGAGGA